MFIKAECNKKKFICHSNREKRGHLKIQNWLSHKKISYCKNWNLDLVNKEIPMRKLTLYHDLINWKKFLEKDLSL